MTTTLTLKGFAQKLGFKRVSDPRFRTLLKQWEIEGAIKVYQGGYRGHSTGHPKKTQLSKPLDYFANGSKGKESSLYMLTDRRMLLDELGFKIVKSAQPHKCSYCKGKIQSSSNYAMSKKPIFFAIKLCAPCVKHLCEHGGITVNPQIKMRGET